MPSTAQRQKVRKSDRRLRRVCINGEAFVVVDGASIRVDRFLDEGRDTNGYPTRGVYMTPEQEVTFSVGEVKLGKHAGAGEHGRCKRCWRKKLRAAKAARAKAARVKTRARKPAVRPRARRTPPAAQGAFQWAA